MLSSDYPSSAPYVAAGLLLAGAAFRPLGAQDVVVPRAPLANEEAIEGPRIAEEGGGPLRLQTAPAPQTSADNELYRRIRRLMSSKPRERRRAARALVGAQPSALVPLVDAYFFMTSEARRDALPVLEKLAGEQYGSRYRDWFVHVGGSEVLPTPPGYTGFKGELFARIDPAYRRILSDGATVRLRLREVGWGGVPLDGIPAIDHPATVPGHAARFMRATDTVFGVSLGGEHRAYPVKVLSWHELLNDTVGGTPVTLSFCTLCGSGILYRARGQDGERLTFGTSGLLYRSNKLMFDRATLSLWSNLTGEAVVGPQAERGTALEMLPMTLARWDTWLRLHADTTVIQPDPSVAQRYGYRYVEGAADEARAGVEFAVARQSDALDRNTEIYALRIEGKAKAWPLELLRAERLVHDALGGKNIVLVADPSDGSVRVYERRNLTFQVPSEGAPLRQLLSESGAGWRLAEDRLIPEAGGSPLLRIPGHVAFWFGWYAFYPETEIYQPQ